MEWRRFLGRRKPANKSPEDKIDRLAERIERFAPKEHRADRGGYYYHYKIMALYTKPLQGLLEWVADNERFEQDPVGFSTEAFVRLKHFYDPRNRLSMSEALQDPALRRKYEGLFHLFYGRAGGAFEEISVRLEKRGPL